MTANAARRCGGPATSTGQPCTQLTTHPSGRCPAHRTRAPHPDTHPHTPNHQYQTPAAMRAALTERAKQAATEDPTYDVSQRLRQHCYVRFLDRLFDDDPDRWMIKGGGALLARLPDARHTRDLDLWTSAETIDDGIQAVEESVAAANAEGRPDHLTFTVGEWTSVERHGRPMARTKITATIDGKVISQFGVDLVAGEPSTVPADEIPAPQPIPVPGLPRGTWRVYPADAHTADKVAACFESYGGVGSSRFRDLSDLAHLSWEERFDAAQLTDAVHQELAKRSITNPGRFTVPNEHAWRQGWDSPKNRAHALRTVPFDTAVRRVQSFLDPVLAGTAKGHWDPELGRWTDQ